MKGALSRIRHMLGIVVLIALPVGVGVQSYRLGVSHRQIATLTFRTVALHIASKMISCQINLHMEDWADQVLVAWPLEDPALPIKEYATPDRLALGIVINTDDGPAYHVLAVHERRTIKDVPMWTTECGMVTYQPAQDGRYIRTVVEREAHDSKSIGSRDTWVPVPQKQPQDAERAPQKPGSVSAISRGISFNTLD